MGHWLSLEVDVVTSSHELHSGTSFEFIGILTPIVMVPRVSQWSSPTFPTGPHKHETLRLTQYMKTALYGDNYLIYPRAQNSHSLTNSQ